MKLLSGFGRLLKSVIGWMFLILFGGTGVYALLDDTRDGPAVIVVCLLLAGVGVLLIRSARRDKKRLEAREEEAEQYRRRQEQKEEQEERRIRQERRDSVAWTTVECPGCGAVAQVRRGGVCRCEYCGTALKGD